MRLSVHCTAPPASSYRIPAGGMSCTGRRFGHALHPLLTDLPLGFWMSSNVLDLVGGQGFTQREPTAVDARYGDRDTTAVTGLGRVGVYQRAGTARGPRAC